jgi:hypothetical protein
MPSHARGGCGCVVRSVVEEQLYRSVGTASAELTADADAPSQRRPGKPNPFYHVVPLVPPPRPLRRARGPESRGLDDVASCQAPLPVVDSFGPSLPSLRCCGCARPRRRALTWRPPCTFSHTNSRHTRQGLCLPRTSHRLRLSIINSSLPSPPSPAWALRRTNRRRRSLWRLRGEA